MHHNSCRSNIDNADQKDDSLGNGDFVRYDFATIRSATSNFSVSNRLGEGAFGAVYKGTLKNGKQIAIKRLHGDINLSTEVFMNECAVVARIQHTNLIRHLGFCSEGEGKFLVYEFLPNASLASLLCDPTKRVLINWETWYKIILGIARGLEYLHNSSYPTILHLNLTTNNVLLDEEMNPKIADFGMNGLFESRPRRTSTSATAIGTYAYIAPEYGCSGAYYDKSNVYSYGVIVLESLTDLKNGKDTIYSQAWKLLQEGRLSELINPGLRAKCSETELMRYIEVGLMCVQEVASSRPTMREVIMMLTDMVASPVVSTPVII